MIRSISQTLFLLVLAVIALPATAAPRDLMVSSSDEAIVLARVQQPDKAEIDAPAERSVILTRKLGRETHWRKLATLSGRIVSIAVCDEDAKVLLDSGDWMTIWSSGTAFGPGEPGVRFIAFAADHETLWAVGVPAPLTSPATQAATQAATQSSTQPTATTLPTPATLPADAARPSAIYRFDGESWKRVLDLPPDLDTTDPATITLSVVDQQPILATSVGGGGGGLHLWKGMDDHWSVRSDIALAKPVSNFDIVAAAATPMLWLTSGGPGSLADVAGERTLGPDGGAATDPRSATRAAEAIRLFSASGDHLFEQTYRPDGTPIGKRSELVVDLVGPDSQVESWLAPTLTVIVTMLLFSAARRGTAADLPPPLVEAHLELAPLSVRFGAGAIDALPVILSILYVARQMALAGATDQVPTNEQMIPFYVGCGIYLIYTITTELLLGRTFGKWLVGLQIVTLEGTAPTRTAILVRNLLRVIDLMLMWLPLVMVLFSPMRQRIGDLAAGTVVARHSVPPTENTSDQSGEQAGEQRADQSADQSNDQST